MKKIYQKKTSARGAGKKGAEITKLPRLEMYAVLGLELGKKIFEKLEQLDKLIEAIACEIERQAKEKKQEAKAKQQDVPSAE